MGIHSQQADFQLRDVFTAKFSVINRNSVFIFQTKTKRKHCGAAAFIKISEK